MHAGRYGATWTVAGGSGCFIGGGWDALQFAVHSCVDLFGFQINVMEAADRYNNNIRNNMLITS